jgi:MinD superfamily P-loop ATPase
MPAGRQAGEAGPKGITIAVASGKGGTGKTLVATSLATALARNGVVALQLIDCDVEEPNAHVLLDVNVRHRQAVEVLVPSVNKALCTHCGVCAEFCQANAIAVIREATIVFPDLCTGCGGCAIACPENAISEAPREVGWVVKGVAEPGVQFYQGWLNVGEARARPVLTAAKSWIDAAAVTILDAPPGTACPMQETVEGSDYTILVAEQTPFGLNDLQLSIEVLRTLRVPFGVIINRDGLGDDSVERYCAAEGIEVLLRIPQLREIACAYAEGRNLVAAFPDWAARLEDVFDRIVDRRLAGESPYEW